MTHNLQSSQILENDNLISLDQGVCFDPERILLEGIYSDELSVYRARKRWAETFESCFLLDAQHDYELTIVKQKEIQRYKLNCRFVSACARYAFWRLTNNQAPEAQYMIETAHIPDADSHAQELASAPDLISVQHIQSAIDRELEQVGSIKEILKKIIAKLVPQ